MRKLIYCLILINMVLLKAEAQQLPYLTQMIGNDYLQNPAIAGTKRTLDARLNYRAQWVGFEGAPTTESFSLNNRFYKGKMGAGLYFMEDKIGPSKQLNSIPLASFIIKLPPL